MASVEIASLFHTSSNQDASSKKSYNPAREITPLTSIFHEAGIREGQGLLAPRASFIPTGLFGRCGHGRGGHGRFGCPGAQVCLERDATVVLAEGAAPQSLYR